MSRDYPLLMGFLTGLMALLLGILSDNPNTWKLNFPLGFVAGYGWGCLAYLIFRK